MRGKISNPTGKSYFCGILEMLSITSPSGYVAKASIMSLYQMWSGLKSFLMQIVNDNE